MENKKIFFAEASDTEIKKLVDNSAQRNMKKSAKYTGTINVRSPWEIIRRVIKYINPFPAYWCTEGQMPSTERLSSKFYSCPQSFASWPWALSTDIPATKRGLFTKQSPDHQNFHVKFAKKRLDTYPCKVSCWVSFKVTVSFIFFTAESKYRQ